MRLVLCRVHSSTGEKMGILFHRQPLFQVLNTHTTDNLHWFNWDWKLPPKTDNGAPPIQWTSWDKSPFIFMFGIRLCAQASEYFPPKIWPNLTPPPLTKSLYLLKYFNIAIMRIVCAYLHFQQQHSHVTFLEAFLSFSSNVSVLNHWNMWQLQCQLSQGKICQQKHLIQSAV